MNRVTRIGQLGGSHKPATITDPLKTQPILTHTHIYVWTVSDITVTIKHHRNFECSRGNDGHRRDV